MKQFCAKHKMKLLIFLAVWSFSLAVKFFLPFWETRWNGRKVSSLLSNYFLSCTLCLPYDSYHSLYSETF